MIIFRMFPDRFPYSDKAAAAAMTASRPSQSGRMTAASLPGSGRSLRKNQHAIYLKLHMYMYASLLIDWFSYIDLYFI